MHLEPARAGHVHLVGAGPGDAGLVTLRAHALLASCDVVLYDQLVGPGVHAFFAAGSERIAVGKIGHGEQVAQAEIHRLMVDRARAGRAVVRLQGGCPTVFGRLAEEVAALRAAGIPYEVVPGVSSALAVPAAAGLFVTERGRSSSLAVVSAHTCGEERDPYASVAHADTLVVLMGARGVGRLARDLQAAGRPAGTPAAFVSRGTLPGQRAVWGTLGTLERDVVRAGLAAPAVIVVGEAARPAGPDNVVAEKAVSDVLVS
jgi:uroporphyrin-III C-methyltransferase